MSIFLKKKSTRGDPCVENRGATRIRFLRGTPWKIGQCTYETRQSSIKWECFKNKTCTCFQYTWIIEQISFSLSIECYLSFVTHICNVKYIITNLFLQDNGCIG